MNLTLAQANKLADRYFKEGQEPAIIRRHGMNRVWEYEVSTKSQREHEKRVQSTYK